ncbi:MAG TPA: hypothetical protein VH442_11555 [Micromonosporaceae bacterium]
MSTDANRTITIPSTNGSVPQPVPQPRTGPGTYVADTYTGDLGTTVTGAPKLANDGEPAGLARVTMAMRRAPKQPPAPGRLVGLCAWAAVIGIIGLMLGVWSGVAVLSGAPGWFFPLAAVTGLVGFTSTVASYFAARDGRRPWVLLGIASVTLIVALILVEVQ